MSNWGLTVYCIPSQGEKESKKEIDPSLIWEKSNKRTERRPEGAEADGGFFLHFWDLFGSISSRQLNHPWKRQYLGNRAKGWNISQILCTAGVLERLQSNVHTEKQQYWPDVVSAQSKMNPFSCFPFDVSINSFNPVKKNLQKLVFKAKIWDDFHQFVPFLHFSVGGTDRCKERRKLAKFRMCLESNPVNSVIRLEGKAVFCRAQDNS